MSGTYQTKTGMNILQEYFTLHEKLQTKKKLTGVDSKKLSEIDDPEVRRFVELQMMVVDMTRRSPLAVVHAANNKSYHDELYKEMPYYMTFRKLNDGLIRYDKIEIRERISATHGLSPDKEEAEADTGANADEASTEKTKREPKPAKAAPVEAKPGPGRGRKKVEAKQPVAVGAASESVNIEDIFTEDEDNE